VHLDGNPILTGTTPLERAIVLMMQHRTEAYVIEPVGIFFHYGTPGWGTELPKYKAPELKSLSGAQPIRILIMAIADQRLLEHASEIVEEAGERLRDLKRTGAPEERVSRAEQSDAHLL
jgi:hypothetical protein